MFLFENSPSSHPQKPRRKTLPYLSSSIALACAGVIFGSSVKEESYAPVSTEKNTKTPFSVSVGIRELVENVIHVQETERLALLKQQEENRKNISRLPLNDRGIFWSRIFRDLHLDTGTMLGLIQRESKGFSHLTSSKGAKGVMQIKDIVLDDMRGVEGMKRYGKLFLALQNDTIEKANQNEDKMKIIKLKKLIRGILLSLQSKDKEELGTLLDEYNELIFSLKIELYSPDINVILGSIYMKYLQEISDSVQKYEQAEVVIKNLNDDDIYRINQLRHADKKNLLPPEYDFSILNIRKILPLALYNVGPNAKDIKPGILYAIAILA